MREHTRVLAHTCSRTPGLHFHPGLSGDGSGREEDLGAVGSSSLGRWPVAPLPWAGPGQLRQLAPPLAGARGWHGVWKVDGTPASGEEEIDLYCLGT